MAVRTIDCSACGSTVPYGRLSCPSCGDLLASVAGAMRPLRSVAAIAEPSTIGAAPVEPSDPHDLAAGGVEWSSAVDESAAEAVPGTAAEPPDTGEWPSAAAESLSAAQPQVAGELPAAVEWPVAADPLPEPGDAPGPEASVLAPAAVDSRAIPSVLHEPAELPAATSWFDDRTDDETQDEAPLAAGPAEDDRASLGWPPAIEPASIASAPVSAWPTPAPTYQPSTPGTSLPGAYLPPRVATQAPAVATPAPALATQAPAAASTFPLMDTPPVPAPARAWGGVRAEDGERAGGRTRAAAGDELRALTDPAKRDEMLSWVAVAGGTLGAIGFLLPWSRTVIGSDGIDYFSSWGFAGPGHLFVVLGLLAVVALALVGLRVPAWIRLGAPGLFLGGLVLGLAWPYIAGPLGAMPGVWLSVVGTGVLTAASIAALVGARHGARPQDV